MLTNYLNIFYQSIIGLPYIAISVIIVFYVSLIILIFIAIIILLDNVYRPNISQYPFNIFFDQIIPIIFLISPTIFTLIFLPKIGISFIQIFCIMLLIHIFILIPVLHFWSNLRSWDISFKNQNQNYIILDNPILYKQIAIAIIYPAIWGVYFSIVRYLRLGNEINLNILVQKFNMNINIYTYILLTIFLWPFVSIWIRLILWKFMDFRLWLWEQTKDLFYSFNLYLLRFDIYYQIAEILYKISFLWISYINHNPLIYLEYPRSTFRKTLTYIYRYPIIIYIIIIILTLLEIIYTHGYIYYSFYLLMSILLISPLIKGLNTLAISKWLRTCCIADYIAGKWHNPRYYENFWLLFNDIRKEFNNQPPLTEEVINKLQLHILNIKIKTQQDIKKNNLLLSYTNRIKYAYNRWAQVRWVHTTTVSSVKSVWHPMISLFARKATDYIAIMNNDWSQHYNIIEKLKKPIPYQQIKYKHFITPNLTKLDKIMEHNLQTNFVPLLKRKVKLFAFNKNIAVNTHNQARDDIIIDPTKAEPPIKDIRVHAMDQKASLKVTEGSSKILSQVSPEYYNNDILTNFEQTILNNCDLSPEIFDQITLAIDALRNSCEDVKLHQIIWLESLYLFPDNYIPPMRIPNNFSIEDLDPAILNELHQSNILMQRISDLLYFHKIPSDYAKAIEYFNDSFIQQIYKEASE